MTGAGPGRPRSVGTPASGFEAAGAGDPRAIAVRDTFVTAVAAAVRIVALTCDVQYVVLDRGIAAVGEPLRAAVSSVLRAQAAPSPFLRNLAISERLRIMPHDLLVAPVGAARAPQEHALSPSSAEVVH